MSLAVVRSLRSSRRLSTAQELGDFEQELVDQYALAMVDSGIGDGYTSTAALTGVMTVVWQVGIWMLLALAGIVVSARRNSPGSPTQAVT